MLEYLRRTAAHVNAADRELVRRSAVLPASAADPSMKALGRAANHSGLWLGAAALLATRKGPTRRAAVRGVLAVAGASAVTNLLGKPLLPRRRPATSLLPRRRRYSAPPRS